MIFRGVCNFSKWPQIFSKCGPRCVMRHHNTIHHPAKALFNLHTSNISTTIRESHYTCVSLRALRMQVVLQKNVEKKSSKFCQEQLVNVLALLFLWAFSSMTVTDKMFTTSLYIQVRTCLGTDKVIFILPRNTGVEIK